MAFYPTFLLGAVFLLFPVAHFRFIETIPLYLAEIPLLLAFAFFFLSSPFQQRTLEFLKREGKMILILMLFVGGALVPLLLQDNLLETMGLLKSFIVLPLLLFLLLPILIRQEQEQRQILSLWWLGLVASALAGQLLTFQGFLTYDGRLSSLYASPNQLAMLLSPGVLIGIWLGSTARSLKERYLYVIGTLIIIVALLATRSYGSCIAIFLSSFFLCASFLSKRWGKIICITLLLMLSMGWFLLEGRTEKFQSLFDLDERSSLASRLMIWEAAVKINQDFFPWGIGLGQFQTTYLAYQKFFPPYLEWAVPEPHNLFLGLLLSTGLLGLVGFLLLGGKIVLCLWKVSKQNSSLLGKLYLALIAYIFLVGLVDTPYFKNDLAFMVWGILGLSLSWLLSQERASATN